VAVPVLQLASTSPRRRALLDAAGIRYVLTAPAAEPAAAGSPRDKARARALAKVGGSGPVDGWRLAVDTVVDLDGQELGKAATPAAAVATLERLQGRRHFVHTAHAVRSRAGCVEELATAEVEFAPLDAEAIRAFVRTDAWRGKAGAYGIQDPEATFARLVDGARDTVVGLHVAAVRRLLAASGFPGDAP